MNYQVINNQYVFILLMRFLKEHKIYIQTMFVLKTYHPNKSVIELLDMCNVDVELNRYHDIFFQETSTFAPWSLTKEGHVFWRKISALWRITLFNSNVQVNAKALIEVINYLLYKNFYSKKTLLEMFPKLEQLGSAIINTNY